MIGIGISENVYLENVQLDDKGILAITFAEAGQEKKEKPTSLFDIVAADEVVENNSGMSIKVFPPLPPKEDPTRTEARRQELAVGDINKTKGILLHILRGYLTQAQIKEKGGLQPFKGLPITQENFGQLILQKEMLEAIHRNMCTDFLNMIRDFLDKPDMLFRLLLVRQSKDKHYASFRGRFIEENPFWESMDVPKEQSKVKFTPYELKEGLNDSTPVAKPAGGEQKGNNGGGNDGGEAPLTAANVFG